VAIAAERLEVEYDGNKAELDQARNELEHAQAQLRDNENAAAPKPLPPKLLPMPKPLPPPKPLKSKQPIACSSVEEIGVQ